MAKEKMVLKRKSRWDKNTKWPRMRRETGEKKSAAYGKHSQGLNEFLTIFCKQAE